MASLDGAAARTKPAPLLDFQAILAWVRRTQVE
jgi:hypothetical protein